MMAEIERQYCLLIVDDEIEIGNTYRDYFVRGFQVKIAKNGQEGLEKLRTGEFNVAIVDLLMPKMKGIDMIRQAREEGINTDMIILTGHGERDEAVESINLEVNGWFDKSGIEMPKLLKKVKELSEGIPIYQIRQILSAIPE
ncbi:MAG: response regulator [Thioploca sp.]|nr:response regulator [Thioploca sp.]